MQDVKCLPDVQTRSRNSQAGFNLIEAAIVLGIVGLIVGGIWAAASSTYENMRQQGASKNLLSLAQSIRSFYANSGSGSIDVSVSNAILQGLVPTDMRQGTTNMISPWGSEVTLATDVIASVPVFGILYTGLTQQTCSNLISRNTSASAGSGLVAVSGTGTAPGSATDFPLPTSGSGSALSYCTSKLNSPSFWFSIN